MNYTLFAVALGLAITVAAVALAIYNGRDITG